MKTSYLLLLLFFLSLTSLGQTGVIQTQVNDTIWFNKKWAEAIKDSANYYRITKYDSINQRYIVKDYYLNGQLQMSGRYISFEPKIMDGIFTWYYADKTIEHRYSNDKLFRKIEWNKNGEVTLDEGSNLVNTVKYVDGDPIYEMKHIELVPEFPGGIDVLMKYLQENIIYPVKAKKKNIAGKVIIEFVVNKHGKVVNETVFNSVDPLLDAEALRVVKEMPQWKPGKQNGKNINVKMHLPVTFTLEN